MKVTLSLLCVLFFLSSHAQTQLIEQYKIDSVGQLIEKQAPDNERVHLLHEYARLNFYNLDIIKGFEAVSEARELAKKIDFKF